MEKLLEDVCFDTYSIYSVGIKLIECPTFENSNEETEYGESLDSVSQIRRSIKQSEPFYNKKIIEFINVEDDKEDEDGIVCRDIQAHYYLLVNNEEAEEFCVQTMHDDLEEEWRNASPQCEVNIKPYEA